MKIHHVGYLVKNIGESIRAFEILGYKIVKNIIYDPIRDVDISFIEKDGYMLELVQPKSNKSVVANLAKKLKVSPYHICYEVKNIDDCVRSFQGFGYIIIDEKEIAPALESRPVFFCIIHKLEF